MLIKVLLLSLIGFACYASDLIQERVTVKPVVEVEMSKTDILLSDIVVSKGLSRTAMEKFRAIKLSDAPKPGETREFTSSVINDSIRADLESVEAATGEHFEMKIPTRVTVTKKAPSLSEESLKSELTASFKAVCADCEFEITNFTSPTAKLAPDLTFTLRTRPDLPRGSFSYPIEVSNGTTLWVSGQLMVRRPVPVVLREIQIGERIQPEDISTQVKDVTYASDAPISIPELSSGTAARVLSVGNIVFRSSIRRDLAIKMGDIVKVETGTSEWVISLEGISQSSGYVGDQVKVKIQSTGKLIAGRLREQGIVEVIQ